MATIEHRTLGNLPTKMHGIVKDTVANAAALAAYPISSDDVAQKIVLRQLDTDQLWVPLSTTPTFQLISAAVTSVFGRVSAVIAQNGDYNSSQVTNASGVAGATVTAALNTLAAALVLVGTLVSNTAQGQAPQTNGIAGQALISTTTGSTWGTDFGAQTLTTTGDFIQNNVNSVIRQGLVAGSGAGSAAATGTIRWRNDSGGVGVSIKARNDADTGDNIVLAYSSKPSAVIALGDAAGTISLIDVVGTTVQLRGSGTCIIGSTSGIRVDGSAINFNNTVSGPTIGHSSQAAAGTTLTIAAQQSTGAGGGTLLLKAGAGSTANGSFQMAIGVTTIFNYSGALTAVPSTTGDFRLYHNYSILGRNAANTADRVVLSWGNFGNNAVQIGDTSASFPNLIVDGNSARFDLRINTTVAVRVAANTMDLNVTAANFDVTVGGTNVLGFAVSVAKRNVALFAAASTNFQTGDRVLFFTDRNTAPTGNPSGGFYQWSETGGLPTWRNVAGDILTLTLTTAASATAGGVAYPVTCSEFMTINYKGNVRKIPLFAN